MHDVWFVFVAGSAGSFAVMLIVWMAATERRTTLAGRARSLVNVKAKRQFLDCLRREAIARADAVLAASSEPQIDARTEATPAMMQSQIADARRTVEQLFSTDALDLFDQAAAQVRAVPRGEATSHAVSQLRKRLRDELEPSLVAGRSRSRNPYRPVLSFAAR